MHCYFAMSHGSWELNLGPKKLVLARDMRSRSWLNIGDSYGTYFVYLYKLTFMFCHLVWLAVPCVIFLTYVTKTRANLYTYSRKPGNYNGIIIFEIDIMKKFSQINLKFTFLQLSKPKCHFFSGAVS